MPTSEEKLITLSNLEQFKQDLDPYLVHNLFTLTTVAGNANSGNYLSVRWYVSGVDGITEPYDGMKIAIKIPLAGVSTAGAMLSLNGNTDADYHPLAYNNNTVLTSHFPVNSVKIFTYVANQNMTCYKTKNTSSSVAGIWKAEGDYDSNTTMTYGTLAYYLRPYAAQTIYDYRFVMQDKDNRLVPLVTDNIKVYSSSTSYTVGTKIFYSGVFYNCIAAGKGKTPPNATYWEVITPTLTPTAMAFKPDKIYWYNTTTTIAAGAAIGGNTLMSVGYNANNISTANFPTLVPTYKMIYLCGTYNKTTGLFTLRDGGTASSNYYTLVPDNTANITLSSYFASGYDYILLGGTYSTAGYIHLREDHPIYHFDGTNLVPYDTYHINNQVTANPTLAGTESDLTSLQIGNTKYKIPTMEDIGSTITEELLDDNVKLSEDLYVYTNVGLITGASSTSPKLVGEAGDSIKDVFNNMFVGQDENPTVTIPTLSISLATNGGESNSLVKGEIITPKYNISYGNVNGSYQYGSIETKTSTNTGVAVASSSFTIGGTAVTPDATISNSVTSATITSPTTIVVKSSGSSQTVGGTINLDLTNVKTARTKLGKAATNVKSGSTGSLDANGKLSNTTITKSPTSINVTSSTELSVTKPSANITLSSSNGGTVEVGTQMAITAKISTSYKTGVYPNGYFVNNTGSINTSTDAGCALTSLSLKQDGTEILSNGISDDNVTKNISITAVEGSKTVSFTGSVTFSCDTSRCPASKNKNMIDISISDRRINGSSNTYSPSVFSATYTVTGVNYPYYGFGSSSSTAPSSKIRGNTSLQSTTGQQLTYTSGNYVWIFSKTNNSNLKIMIYSDITQDWSEMLGGTTAMGSITFTKENGASDTFYGYRTVNSAVSGATAKIRLTTS